jgi:hypothetical protein
VFFLPELKSPYQRYYTTGKVGYGGSKRYEGSRIYHNPLFVRAASGGRAPKLAYDYLVGQGNYEDMRSRVIKATMWSRTPDAIENLLSYYQGDSSLAYDILRHSTVGNTLAYAIQEHIVAATVRRAGYDAVIGYTKILGGWRLSEVFDVKMEYYPEVNPLRRSRAGVRRRTK